MIVKMNKAQQRSLLRKWQQNSQGYTYRQFRRTVIASFYDMTVMVEWCGMWLGIEEDGYTHS